MLRLLKPANPEDLFVERYDALLGWALSLTDHNQAQAEDLVHDAFIQFTHRRGDLAAIENTDAYLNRMLRNMYLSEARRGSLILDTRISIADFDSAELGLRASRANDPHQHLDLQDDLRRICQYASARKETSKAGSVLILRFFHGYYPSEIAQVLQTTRVAVDRWLQIARREAKLFLSDPGVLKFMSDKLQVKPGALGSARTSLELMAELRETIFAARSSECLTEKELKASYRGKATIDGPLLSHVVSCARCLDTVNGLLGLPELSERRSDERLGRDVPPDKSGGSGTGRSGISTAGSKKKYERREKEVIEHRPQELRIAVNGFVLGRQRVSSELSKLALTVNIDEPIAFVEVFSEQGVRLLFFEVDQPANGTVDQVGGVNFDCGRSLDVAMSFRGPWPTLDIAYHDPTFDAIQLAAEDLEEEASSLFDGAQFNVVASEPISPLSWVRSLSKVFDSRLLLRPGPITTFISALLLVAIVLLYRQPSTVPSAADLLQRAAASEELLASNRDLVVHRSINIEGRSGAGEVVMRQKIEVWRSAEKGITARRLYDERGALIAGDWRRSDGVQTLYHHVAKPQLRPIPEKRQLSELTSENMWQLDPSARDFSWLVGDKASALVEEVGNAYIVSAESEDVIKAKLVLSKADLHATELTLTVRDGSNRQSAIGDRQWIEFRLVETSLERRPTNAVAPAVFEPEQELNSERMEDGGRMKKAETPSSSLASSAPRVVATTALEVQVLSLLNSANAFMGDQLRVTHTPDGKLLVAGLVDADARKAELVRALDPVRSNPAVRVEIETAAEAERRERPKSRGNISVDRVEAVEGTSPVYEDLKKRFSESEARAFSDRILSHSAQARSHALALKQLAGRFSTIDLETLSEDDRARWIGLLREHARAYERETANVEKELQIVFPSMSGASDSSVSEIASDSQLQEAARRVYDLSVFCDGVLRQSFAISVNGDSLARVQTEEFWSSLKSGKALAARIQAAR